MASADAVLHRMMTAVRADTQAILAEFLGTQQPSIARALSKNEIPELWLYKVAERTGRRLEWLQTGTGPEYKSQLVTELMGHVDSLRTRRHDLERWGLERGKASALLTDLEMIVHLAECASVASEESAPYQNAPGVDASGLDEEEIATIRRLIAAFKSGDKQVRSHLIGQLRLIDELVKAKHGARTKKAAE